MNDVENFVKWGEAEELSPPQRLGAHAQRQRSPSLILSASLPLGYAGFGMVSRAGEGHNGTMRLSRTPCRVL